MNNPFKVGQIWCNSGAFVFEITEVKPILNALYVDICYVISGQTTPSVGRVDCAEWKAEHMLLLNSKNNIAKYLYL